MVKVARMLQMVKMLKIIRLKLRHDDDGALFHSTPESPIDRGTIQQAIWSKTQIYLMVTKTFARFSPDFI